MSALLGGGDRRAPLMAASRRGLPLDPDVEDSASEDEASFDLVEQSPSTRRKGVLLLTTVTVVGLAAALGAGALIVASKGHSIAVAGRAPATITLASADDAVPDLSPLRAAMLARADSATPATGEQDSLAPEPREAASVPAPTAPAKEASAPGVPVPEPVVVAAAAPATPAPEPPTPAPAVPAPGASFQPPALTAAEAAALMKRARGLIEIGDIAAARRFLERGAAARDGAALFALAETHDPAVLDRWRVHGVKADVEKARELYRQAAERGVGASAARLAALR